MKGLIGLCTIVAAACLVLPISAMASSSPVPSGSPGAVVFRMGWAEDTDGVNPFSAHSSPSLEALLVNYNQLTNYDQNYNVTPDLATSREHSADGRTWTFHMRTGVTWQDGQPLTANDVAFTYNLVLDNPTVTGIWPGYLQFVTSVTAPDPQTVVIKTSRPSADMLDNAIPILPEHIWSKVPKGKLATFANVPCVGSGPFQVVEVKKSSYIKLVANKAYYGGSPSTDEMLFEIYTQPESVAQDIKAGLLDATSQWGVNSYQSLKNDPNVKTGAYPNIGYEFIGFNTWGDPKSKGAPALRDARVRTAMAWAIDKKKIVDTAMQGLATVADSPISPLTPWNWGPSAEQAISYDPAKAASMLEAAGYRMGPDGVRVDSKGQPLEFKLVAMTQYPQDQTAAKLLSSYWGAVGIKTDLSVMDEVSFFDYLFSGNFDIYLEGTGWGIGPRFSLEMFTTAAIGSSNLTFYSNPRYDQLYTDQASLLDTTARKGVVDEMQQILYEQSPAICLWNTTMTDSFSTNKWTGWTFVPADKGGGPMRNWTRYTYEKLTPVADTAEAAASGSSASVAIVVAIVVVVACVVVGVVVVRRRRQVKEVE